MKLSLYLAATLVLSISSASARPAQVAANQPKLATESIAADTFSSLPNLEAAPSAGPVAVPDPDLSEDVLKHPLSMPTVDRQLVSAPPVIPVLPTPVPDATNLKMEEASAAVEKKFVPMASSVLPSIPALQTSIAAPLAVSSSVLKNSSPEDVSTIAAVDHKFDASGVANLNRASATATYSIQKAGNVFDPESIAHTVNVKEGYPIVPTELGAAVPTTPTIPSMKVDAPTKVALSVPDVDSSAPSLPSDDFETTEADLMGTEVVTTAFAAVLPTSSVLDVLDSVPEPASEKIQPTNINLPAKPIPAEPSSSANLPKEPLANLNGEKMDDALPLPIPLSSVDLPFAPPKPTIISVASLPSLALPTPPPSTASAVLPHFAGSVPPVQDKYVELAQAMGRASGALADVKEAVDRYIKEHMQDGKMIDMHNIKQQNKQPNLVHAFIDFQKILDACKVLISSMPGIEAITNEDLQRLIQESHDLMIRARQMEIEYFENMAGMNAKLQQFPHSLLEQSDIEKALNNDNNQETTVPQLNPDELAKLVSQFVEEMQKFLIDFAKAFIEINPAVPTPSIQIIPEPTLPSLSIIHALPSAPVSIPISIPLQVEVQSAATTIPTSLADPVKIVPAQPELTSSPAVILPASSTLPAPPLPTEPIASFEDMLSDESTFTDLDFVEFLGTGTTYAAVPTTRA